MACNSCWLLGTATSQYGITVLPFVHYSSTSLSLSRVASKRGKHSHKHKHTPNEKGKTQYTVLHAQRTTQQQQPSTAILNAPVAISQPKPSVQPVNMTASLACCKPTGALLTCEFQITTAGQQTTCKTHHTHLNQRKCSTL